VKFDPHGFFGYSEAIYVPWAQFVAFGEGAMAVDIAEDAAIIMHELGHGSHDWVTGGSGLAAISLVEGLPEGIGDYLAQSYCRSLGLWNASDPEYHLLRHWGGLPSTAPNRTTNCAKHCPEGLVGDYAACHTDGQIWSTCNMKI
jgi:hypothetical protein